MAWPDFTPYEMLRHSLTAAPGNVPSPTPGLSGMEPGSLSPVLPEETSTVPPVPQAPPSALVHEANPMPRFEISGGFDDEQSLDQLLHENPFKGLTPSEELRASRLGMMQAGATMAAAADSGHGFASAVTQGILAGNMAAEDARMRYGEMELRKLEENRKRREHQAKLTGERGPYRPNLGVLSEKELDREYLAALEYGDKDTASELRLMRDDLHQAGEGTGPVEWVPQEDGSEQGFVRFGTEMVPLKNAVRRPSDSDPDVFIGEDGQGNRIARNRQTGQELWRETVKADGSPDRRSPVEVLANMPKPAFREMITNDSEVTDEIESMKNIEGELGQLSIGNFMGSEGDPIARWAQSFRFVSQIDESVVRPSEFEMLKQLGHIMELPENWWNTKVKGQPTREKVARAMALFSRVRTGLSVERIDGWKDYYGPAGRKIGLSDEEIDSSFGPRVGQTRAAIERFDREMIIDSIFSEEEKQAIRDLYRSSNVRGFGDMDWSQNASLGSTERPSFDDLMGGN